MSVPVDIYPATVNPGDRGAIAYITSLVADLQTAKSAQSTFQSASQVAAAIATAVVPFQTASQVSATITAATSQFQTAAQVQNAIVTAQNDLLLNF